MAKLISVCVASIGRESLLDTLESIIMQELAPEYALEIVVADDSKEHVVGRLLDDNPRDWRRQVRILESASNNIAIARNHCIEYSKASDFIAFIDDDETASKTWLKDMLHAMQVAGADAIFGPVIPSFSEEAPASIVKSKIYEKRPARKKGPITSGVTSNALVKTSTITGNEIQFRVQFGRTGGEDTDFFSRLHRAGALLVATDEGAVYERVPNDRCTLSSIRRRYQRGGHTLAVLRHEFHGNIDTFKFRATVMSKAAAYALVASLVWFPRRYLAIRLLSKSFGNIGQFRAALGYRAEELYAR